MKDLPRMPDLLANPSKDHLNGNCKIWGKYCIFYWKYTLSGITELNKLWEDGLIRYGSSFLHEDKILKFLWQVIFCLMIYYGHFFSKKAFLWYNYTAQPILIILIVCCHSDFFSKQLNIVEGCSSLIHSSENIVLPQCKMMDSATNISS